MISQKISLDNKERGGKMALKMRTFSKMHITLAKSGTLIAMKNI